MGSSRAGFRRAVSGRVPLGAGMVEVRVLLRPGWNVVCWWMLFRLSRPAGWVVGVGVSGPRRSGQAGLPYEVALLGQADLVYAWLMSWSRQCPDRMFVPFGLDCGPLPAEGVSG